MANKTHRYVPLLPCRQDKSSLRITDPGKFTVNILKKAFAKKPSNCLVSLKTLNYALNDGYHRSSKVKSRDVPVKANVVRKNRKKSKQKSQIKEIVPEKNSCKKPLEFRGNVNPPKSSHFRTKSSTQDSDYIPNMPQISLYRTQTFESIDSDIETGELKKSTKLWNHEFRWVSEPRFLLQLPLNHVCYIISDDEHISNVLLNILDHFKRTVHTEIWGTFRILAIDKVFDPSLELLMGSRPMKIIESISAESDVSEYTEKTQLENMTNMVYRDSRNLNLSTFHHKESSNRINSCIDKLNKVVEDEVENLRQIIIESKTDFDDYLMKNSLSHLES